MVEPIKGMAIDLPRVQVTRVRNGFIVIDMITHEAFVVNFPSDMQRKVLQILEGEIDHF